MNKMTAFALEPMRICAMVLFIVVLTIVMAVAGCRNEPGPSVEKIESDPSRYYGKEVTVLGEVGEIYNDRAFLLQSRDLWPDALLVVTKTTVRGPGPLALDKGDDVRVTGIVHKLTVTEVERDIGWDLDTQLEVEYRDKPMIVAREIRLLKEEGRWEEGKGLVGSAEPQAAPQGQAEPPVEAMQIPVILAAPVPDELVGKRVKVQDAPVQKVVRETVFWIGEGTGQGLLVVLPEDQPAETEIKVAAGEKLTVTGTLRKMPDAATAAQQWRLDDKTAASLGTGRLYLEPDKIEQTRP